MIKKITNIKDLQKILRTWNIENRKVAFIPTMGNLHKGHLKLIEVGSKYTNNIIVSIFVNPMQFENYEDYKNYPSSLEEDEKKLNLYTNNILLFCPKTEIMYPNGLDNHTFVYIPKFSSLIEGKIRPKHFQGVTTIISKFLNIIRPNFSIFGEKDYQQLFLIRKMIFDLNYSTNIISVPIVRDIDGLAFSSRNSFLTYKERKKASHIYMILKNLRSHVKNGEKNTITLSTIAEKYFKKFKLNLSQFNICDADTLSPLIYNSKRIVFLLSVNFTKTRIIDNIQVDI